ncbi:EutP/PduV family microcompartment system protein [Desulfoluna sp.]|uniref:EutP/PduV family microcompartment system protein n=1 Tax=Desulfoluna sp. TaxID=2045199 RepID=UPI002634CC80|nr:EutP/PduV family microcompartment system protein [Desulfoluna sp.]
MADEMKKMMLIGESSVGKTTLIRVLSGDEFSTRKTQAVEFCGRFIDTPGEFLENRRFYPALITSSVDCEVVAMVQDATRISSLFPPQFATIFNRKVVGIITKVDVEGCNVDRAERFLKNAGAKDIIRVSAKANIGLDIVQDMLAGR